MMKKHEIDENAANNPTTPETTAEEEYEEAEYDVMKPVENPTEEDLREVEAFNADLKFYQYQRRVRAGELTEQEKKIREFFGLPD